MGGGFVLFLYLVVAVELGSERSSSPGMSDDEDDAQEMVHYFFFLCVILRS